MVDLLHVCASASLSNQGFFWGMVSLFSFYIFVDCVIAAVAIVNKMEDRATTAGESGG